MILGMTNMKFDWKFWLVLVVTIAGVVIPTYLWQFDHEPHSLSVQKISSLALEPQIGPTIQNLQVTLDGEKVESPYLSTLEVKNDGSKAISITDFASPLKIAINGNQQILRMQVISTMPNDLPVSFLPVVDKTSVSLKPLLLNSGDSFNIAILTSGGKPKFGAEARITDVQKVTYDDEPVAKSELMRGWSLLLIAIISTVAFAYQALALFKLRGKSSSALLTAFTLFVSEAAAVMSMSLGFEKIGMKDSLANTIIFIAIPAIIIIVLNTIRNIKRTRQIIKGVAAETAHAEKLAAAEAKSKAEHVANIAALVRGTNMLEKTDKTGQEAKQAPNSGAGILSKQELNRVVGSKNIESAIEISKGAQRSVDRYTFNKAGKIVKVAADKNNENSQQRDDRLKNDLLKQIERDATNRLNKIRTAKDALEKYSGNNDNDSQKR